MQIVLVMFKSDGDRRSFSVARDVTVVGRREDCDLRIPVGDVSRKHCRFVKEADTIRLEDLGSSNGTFINGQRVQEAVLQPGDWIQIGPVQFVIQIDGLPPDDEIAPPIPTGDVLPGAHSGGDQMYESSGPIEPTEHVAGESAEPETPLGEEEPLGETPLEELSGETSGEHAAAAPDAGDAEWDAIVDNSVSGEDSDQDMQVDLEPPPRPLNPG